MTTQMHPQRIEANKAVKRAKAAMDAAATDEQAEMLIKAFDEAIRYACLMDAQYPTAAELKRKSERERMNSMGLWNW